MSLLELENIQNVKLISYINNSLDKIIFLSSTIPHFWTSE